MNGPDKELIRRTTEELISDALHDATVANQPTAAAIKAQCAIASAQAAIADAIQDLRVELASRSQ
jgi:hypothetical protein